MRARVRSGATLLVAAFASALLIGAVADGRPAEAPPAPACPTGTWIRSKTAAWLRRVIEVAGYRVEGCTGSAWIAATPRTSFYIWAAALSPRAPVPEPYTRRPGLPLPTYDDGTRIMWHTQGVRIWVAPGPRAEPLPGRSALGWLQIASQGLPRRYRPIVMMATPPEALARCRSDPRLRPACPRRIPRISGWDTYPRVVNGIFGIQLGGEIPGRPELMRPPRILHIEVAVRPERWVPFRWPAGGLVTQRDGLVRRERQEPVLLGRPTWGGKRGSTALAPGYPVGGSQGNHVMFRWRQGRETYVVGLHAWEPFSEAYATLRRVVVSLPR